MKCPKCERVTIENTNPQLGGLFAHCTYCGHTQTIDSVLKRFLNQRIENSIDYGEVDYLSSQQPELFKPNTLTFVGASMGVGKTYAVITWAKENKQTTIMLVPRVSLAMSLYESYKHIGSVSCWCSASQRDDRHPGRTIHIVTPPMLPTVISKLERTPNIAIDEIDFFDNLIRADILSQSSRSIKQILKEHTDTGIVALGQTAFTQEMKLFADEIGVPLEGIYATKKNPNKHTALIEEIQGDNGKSTVIRKTVEKAIEVLNKQKHVYILADGRRTANIIHERIKEKTGKDGIIFDRYTRGSQDNQQLSERQELSDDRPIFISSNAVDVGISFTDKNAEVIVCTTENLARIGSARSLMQRALRNRVPCPIYIYTFTHGTTPTLPKDYRELEWNRNVYHALIELAEQDATLIERHALVKSLNELSSVQIIDFLEHHAPIAGIDIKSYNRTVGDDEPAEWVHIIGNQYQEDMDTETLKTATKIIDIESLWTEQRIAKEGSLGRMAPQPYEQLGHEMVSNLGRAIGWRGEGCESLNADNTTSGIYNTLHANSDEMLPREFFPLLRKIINEYETEDNELPNYKTLITQAQGFNRVHTGYSNVLGELVPSTQWDDYTYEPDPELESIHNTDDRLQTQILFKIITTLRGYEDDNGVMSDKTAATAIKKALTSEFQGMTLHEHMDKGHLGTYIHQTANNINDDASGYIQFACDWVSAHYPATLTRHHGTYKLARKSYWSLCKEMAEMQFLSHGVPFRFLHEDWFDFNEKSARDVQNITDQAELINMLKNGITIKEASKTLGIGSNRAKSLTKGYRDNEESKLDQEIQNKKTKATKEKHKRNTISKTKQNIAKKYNKSIRTVQKKWKESVIRD